MRDLSEILRDSIAIAEEQLEAARKLDAPTLQETTGFRRELLFELEVATKSPQAVTFEVEELVHTLHELDARLERLLTAGVATIERLRGGDEDVPVYTHEGRIKRNTP